MLKEWNYACAEQTDVPPENQGRARGLAFALLLFLVSRAYCAFAQTPPAANPTAVISADKVTDSALFEDINDPGKRLYLPRFRLAKQTVSGEEQYRVRLTKRGSGANLDVYLEKYPAPELGDAARTAKEIPYEAKVLLRYNLPAANSTLTNVYEELAFQELTFEKDGLKAVLHLNNLEEQDALINALEDPKYDARLLVQRTVTVRGRPQEDIASIQSRIAALDKELQPMIHQETVCGPVIKKWGPALTSGNINSIPKNEQAGAVFCLQQETIIRPKRERLRRDLGPLEAKLKALRNESRPMTVTLDDTTPKRPFTFNARFYPYVFNGISPNPGSGPQLVRKQVAFQNRHYSYFRPADRTDLWYYLPDRFMLAKKNNGDPSLSAEFKGSEVSPTVDLDYELVPEIQPDRLKTAEVSLRSATDSKITFEPLLVEGGQLWLALPGRGSNDRFQKREGASVDLRDGVRDHLNLPLTDFQEVYAALFRSSTLLSGEVRVAPDGTTLERIPVELRVADVTPQTLWDKVLNQTVLATYQKTIQVKTDPAVFQNGVKSLVVNFRGSDSVELEPGKCTGEGREKRCSVSVPVLLSVRDFVLNTENKGKYCYTVTVIPAENSVPREECTANTIIYVAARGVR